jgi:hypothetical protein
LPVQGLDGGRDGKSGGEGSSAELGSSTTGCEDGTDGDIFDELRVDLGAFDEGFESTGEEVG